MQTDVLLFMVSSSVVMLLVSVVLLIVQHFDLTLSIGTAAESLLPLLMLITNVVSTGFIAKITWYVAVICFFGVRRLLCYT